MRAPVNKKKFILTAIIFFIAFGFLAMTAEPAFAQEESYGFESVKEKKYGLDIVAPSSLRKTSEPSEIIGKAIGAVLAFVSVIFFLLTIYGGIIWMTARGNEQQTDKAFKTITSASVGLVIVLGSYVLVGFLFKTISGEPTTEPVVEPVVEAPAVASCVNIESFSTDCRIAAEAQEVAERIVCVEITTETDCMSAVVNTDENCCNWQ